jgi:hypothetical protein
MSAPVLQFKRGNAGVAGTVPALRPGEPAISLNNFDFFIGIDTSVANNKFFGSHRYWSRENGTTSLRLNLVDKDGSNYIAVKSPNTLAGIVTYIFPGTQGASSSVLTNDGSGNLSWSSGSASPVFSGIATFTDTTDNTLGNADTGAVQIDGGLGVNKNLTVGANLNVQGYSEFVGVVTFRGGTINLGDSNTDNINVSGEFISNLTPNTDNTYDIGIGTQRWRNASFAGIGTFATGAVIDAIQIGITAAGEIDTSTGGLTLDSASGQTIIDDNLSVTGIATVTGAFVANGNVTLGDAAGDTITINGTTTFNQPLVGSIGTATRALTVDTTTAPNGTFYPGLFVNSTGTASTAVYVDAGISYVSNTDTLTLTGDLAVNGGDVTTSATTFNLVNATATNVNFAGASTALVMGAATGITTVSNNLTVVGDVRINGNDIQASDGNANITLTSNTLTTFAGDIRVNGNDIQASDGNTNITMTSNTLTEVKGDLQITGNDIKSSTSATALTLSGSDVTAANDLTVTGNLYVNGSTTQVNTASLTVEDRTIDLGIVNGAAPSSTTTWDLGILFNYYQTTAKKSAVIWEHSVTRFQFASTLTSESASSDNNSPQIVTATFAPIEIGELWVNNTCTGGAQQVIGCIGAELNLQNITIDAGTF